MALQTIGLFNLYKKMRKSKFLLHNKLKKCIYTPGDDFVYRTMTDDLHDECNHPLQGVNLKRTTLRKTGPTFFLDLACKASRD